VSSQSAAGRSSAPRTVASSRATDRTSTRPERTIRTGTRPAHQQRPGAARAKPRVPGSRLVVLPDFDPAARAGLGVFVAMIMALLTLGMIALLLLNTALGQGAFELQSLQQDRQSLSDQEQTLVQKVTEQQSPQTLARRASGLGMVPARTPVFLRLSDGVVLGVPLPALRRRIPAPVAAKPAANGAATSSTASTPTPRTAAATPTGSGATPGPSSTSPVRPG